MAGQETVMAKMIKDWQSCHDRPATGVQIWTGRDGRPHFTSCIGKEPYGHTFVVCNYPKHWHDLDVELA